MNPTATRRSRRPPSDPFWYKSGVIYEAHVRAFCDSDANGVGDFRGLTTKLDYLKDLGITTLWLLPFYPSPLRDDGYDIADYLEVHPLYGTLADFKHFLREAHRRSLRVITELVLNHTSDQHPWFQRARRAKPGSRWRNFYVWSDTNEKYRDTRIIFKDVELSNWAWDPVADAYYWHRFFSHQPDLNWDNPEVHEEMLKVIDYWLDLGVDGLRLDAVPYLYEREGTSCENLPETHAVLKNLRARVDKRYGDRMLLGEANQWPEDAVAYFGEGRGDECHMAFHFPLMPRLFMSLRMEDRTPIVDILEQTPAIPETAQWALFLRNHDELTLEMVTDEERDYMYRVYASVTRARLNLGIRRRLAPLLGNDRRRIELLNALLLSLPGTPVLYYGDEIGMGDNIFLGDRNGVRTPMQWSSDKNAGFSRANPQALYLPVIYDPEYHYEAVNVESQAQNPHSLLWWTRRILALRKRWRALGEGRCEFLHPENHKILAYLLRFEQETLLVVANLSRFVQPVGLDLSAFNGQVPVELFGRMDFPVISNEPYFLTLSPHAFYWFSLELRPATAPLSARAGAKSGGPIVVADDWTSVLRDKPKTQLENRLAEWLPGQPWFAAHGATPKLVALREVFLIPTEPQPAALVVLQVEFVGGGVEQFCVPLAYAPAEEVLDLQACHPDTIITDLQIGSDAPGVIYDALVDPDFCRELLELVANRRRLKSASGELEGFRERAFRDALGSQPAPAAALSKAPQRNTSVLFGDKLILKLFRRLFPGLNPDREIGARLEALSFPHAQRLAGALETRTATGETYTLAVLTAYVPEARNAWDYTLEALGRYYDRASTCILDREEPPQMDLATASLVSDTPTAPLIIGTYLDSARLLGERTADFHLALASAKDDPVFAPEPFTPHYTRGLFQSFRNLARQNLAHLRKRLKQLPPATAELAGQVVGREMELIEGYRTLIGNRIEAIRIRCHGDLHLGQWLYTGKDFVLLDFEGDPTLPITERAIKRSPLRDLAGLLRAFHYAAWAGLQEHIQRGSLETERLGEFEPWARLWFRSVGVTCARAYLQRLAGSKLLPPSETEVRRMLHLYLLNHTVLEIGRHLGHRTDRLPVALHGLLGLLNLTPNMQADAANPRR